VGRHNSATAPDGFPSPDLRDTDAMPSPVPALDRAMEVLRHLAQHPRDRFTLSEVARSCDLSKATSASLLATLEAHGMVTRDPGLRYGLGDTLLVLAEGRRTQFPAWEAAREESARLAGQTGFSVAIICRDGDDLVIADMLGDSRPRHLHMRIGTRVPLRPPIGTIFKAWGSNQELAEWVDGLVAEFGGDRNRHLSSIAALRSRCYSLGGEHDLHLGLEAALARLSRSDDDLRALEVALVVADKIRNFDTEAGTAAEAVNSVIAPVFSPDGDVVLTLNMYGPLGSITRGDLPDVVPPLLHAATAVTQRTGGRLPASWQASIKHDI
jgi:DNA-binding IclR family transcriptional regulator